MYLIEGNIGAGKSTFLQLIKNSSPNINVIFEPVNVWQNDEHGKSLLKNFYADTSRWAYSMETFTLINRIFENAKIECGNNVSLAERSIYSGFHCFAKNSFLSGHMTKLEWSMYKQWFDFLTQHPNYNHPKGFIYLRTTPKTAYERILNRSRSAENLISFDYINQIHQKHEDFLVHNKVDLPVLVLDANTNFESNPKEFDKMLTKLNAFILQNTEVKESTQSQAIL